MSGQKGPARRGSDALFVVVAVNRVALPAHAAGRDVHVGVLHNAPCSLGVEHFFDEQLPKVDEERRGLASGSFACEALHRLQRNLSCIGLGACGRSEGGGAVGRWGGGLRRGLGCATDRRSRRSRQPCACAGASARARPGARERRGGGAHLRAGVLVWPWHSPRQSLGRSTVSSPPSSWFELGW